MAKIKDKDLAIKLRLQGQSYSQIKERINVSKGTLSRWLEDYPLKPERIRELRDISPKRIESYRNTMALKRKVKLDEIYKIQKEKIKRLNSRELYLCGLALYWGEGTKSLRGLIAFSNTDPAMIKFFLKWIRRIGIDENKLKLKLQLYSDMNEEDSKDYWSKELGLPKVMFKKTYFKKTKLSDLTYKRGFGHGTCMVYMNNVVVYDKIMMSIKHLSKVPC